MVRKKREGKVRKREKRRGKDYVYRKIKEEERKNGRIEEKKRR